MFSSIKYKYLTFFLVAMACAFDTSCVAAMVALNQDIQEKFGVSYTQTTWALTSYAITFAGFIAFLGRLGDIAGNYYLFTISVLMFSICSLLCATVPNYAAFCVIRALQGISGAGIVPSSYALISVIFDDPSQAGHFLAILSVIFAAFSGIGFIMGGAFAMSNEGYKGFFFLIFGMMLFIFVSSYRFILPLGNKFKSNETRAEKRQKIKELDYPGSLFLIAGSIFVVVGLTEGGESWKRPVAYVCFIIGIILLGAFFIYNIFYDKLIGLMSITKLTKISSYIDSRQVLIPSAVISLPNFWPAMITCFLNYCCFLSSFYIINQYSLFEENNSSIIAAVKLLPVVVGLILSNFVAIFASDKVSPKNGIMAGFFIMFSGSLILIQIKQIKTIIYWKLFFVSGFLSGFGSGLYFPFMLAITVGMSPFQYKGITSGVMQTFGQIGSEVTFSILASILGELSGTKSEIKTRFQNSTYFTLAVAALGFLISVVWIREKKECIHNSYEATTTSTETDEKV